MDEDPPTSKVAMADKRVADAAHQALLDAINLPAADSDTT
jgi:hypothetical protein